ncbi:hypothetical protein QBC43DRAFT_213424 [Cladorrhinum sp. PSN259]|nr:hypothetical protein QBC43DRAFT_213424 [Cladorrhinum sp. PSN259]
MANSQGLVKTGVPPQPLWLLYIKIAIIVLSLITLGLAAWAIDMLGGFYWYGGSYTGTGGMVVFTSIWSFIVYGAAVVLELWAPHFFFRLGALIGYILHIIFWLSAWAWSASAAAWTSSGNYAAATGACAGLGALIWVLSIVHLVFFIRASLADPEGNGAGQAELGQVKPAGQQYPAQQAYPAQQPYATQ